MTVQGKLTQFPRNATAIRCRQHYLQGPLPWNISALFPQLMVLDLSDNQVTGTIPDSLWSIPSLQEVYLERTPLGGSLSKSVERATRLTHLSLRESNLSGSIPREVGSWASVRFVDFSKNSLSGKLPKEIAQWHQAECVSMEANRLSGALPSSIGNWTEIREVHVGDNQLSGGLPEGIGHWRKVEVVDLSSNSFSNSVPSSVGGWSELREVNLTGNGFTGVLPREVGSWVSVRCVDFSNNALSGRLPGEVGQWRKLESVWIDNNHLTGAVPSTVAAWSSVQEVGFSRNNFSGALPLQIGNWSKVVKVSMTDNNLTGPLPASVGSWRALQFAHFANNKLSGPLPASVGQWSLVKVVSLAHNRFSGEVPASIGSWERVEKIELHSNNLSGELPPLANLSALQELWLEDNSFQGALPDLSSCSFLRSLHLSGNSITSIRGLPKSLTSLDLRHNGLMRFPAILSELGDLEELLLSHNSISNWPPAGVRWGDDVVWMCDIFQLPKFRWRKLVTLDASGNDFSGVHAETFLASLEYLPRITKLACKGCGLLGVLPRATSRVCQDKDRFPALLSLDLGQNNIEAVEVEPWKSLSYVDLSRNKLRKLPLSWFNLDSGNRVNWLLLPGNPSLQLEVQPASGACKMSGEHVLMANPGAYSRVNESGVECTSLCRGPTVQYDSDSSLNTSALCRCRQGFAGRGMNCLPCAQNSYSHEQRTESGELVRVCLPCPAGSQTASAAASDISACRCPQGTYLNAGLGKCVQCSQWPFRTTAEGGATSASACSCNPIYTGLKELAGRCGCDDGFHMDRALKACVKCSVAESCVWGLNHSRSLSPPLCKAGFWAEPIENLSSFARNKIWRCTGSASCGAAGRCAAGRQGRACSLCGPRMYGGAKGPCRECPAAVSLQLQRGLLVLGGFFLLVPATLLLHLGLTTRRNDLKVMRKLRAVRASVKQMVKHLQMITVIGKFNVSWPPVALAFFRALGRFTVNFPTLLAAGCLFEENSATSEMLAKWLQPVFFVLAAVMTMSVSWVVSRLLRMITNKYEGTFLLQWLPTPQNARMHLADVGRVLLFTVTLFWSTLASISFEMVTCVPSPNGVLTVATYPHIPCTFKDPEFCLLAMLSMLAAILFLVLPLLVLIKAYRVSAACLATSSLEDRGWYTFMFADFRDGHMVWLILIMVKDAAFTLVAAALPGRGAAQLLVTAAIAALHICLVLQSMPFHNRTNSFLEGWNGATAAALCIYSTGMGFERTSGMEEIAELFESGTEDPIYQGRAAGMVAVQFIAISVPVAVLTYQLLCVVQRTKVLLPRSVRPRSQKETQEWIEDFFAKAGSLAQTVKRFDEAELHLFRSLFEGTAATMGSELESKSQSHLVRMSRRLKEGDESMWLTGSFASSSFSLGIGKRTKRWGSEDLEDNAEDNVLSMGSLEETSTGSVTTEPTKPPRLLMTL